jgi:hypothetical protein
MGLKVLLYRDIVCNLSCSTTYDNFELCPYTFFDRPVDGGVLTDFLGEHYCEFAQFVLLHQLAGAVVVGDGSVEGVFIFR